MQRSTTPARRTLTLACWLLLAFFPAGATAAPLSNENVFNILDYGAKGDDKTKCTEAIQKAIDACNADGGGTVYIPRGVFISGTLHLKSYVAIYLDHGAILKASPNIDDFDPYEDLGFKNDADRETSCFHHAFMWGEDLQRVAFLGTGVIHGNRTARGGPKTISLKRCKNITIKDITIEHAPNYAISMLGTDEVNIDGVSILNGYADGIDPDSCKNVRIANCRIDCWDDAIVPKASFSLGVRRSVEYLTVTNCILSTSCNCFKLGTESGSGFKHIALSNCVMYPRRTGQAPIAGIAIESVDGAQIDCVTVSNISMRGVRSPIFLRLGNRGRDMENPVPGSLRNVIVSNVVATEAEWPCQIAGIPGHRIENVLIDNIRVDYKGGGTLEQASAEVPELEKDYPEAFMFGTLPAYGFYCRHVAGLKLEDIRLSFKTPDLRHALICDDVQNLEIESLSAVQAAGGESVIRFNEVRQAFVHGCQPTGKTNVLIRVPDGQDKEIHLTGNDLRRVKQVMVLK